MVDFLGDGADGIVLPTFKSFLAIFSARSAAKGESKDRWPLGSLGSEVHGPSAGAPSGYLT